MENSETIWKNFIPMLTDSTVILLAKTIFGEAEGESAEGQIAVGCVIRNRVLDPGKDWWGDSYEEVILKPAQFSCWTERKETLEKLDLYENPVGRQCLWIASGIVSGAIMDNTQGANHYLAKWMLLKKVAPKWAVWNPWVKDIGGHVFYKL